MPRTSPSSPRCPRRAMLPLAALIGATLSSQAQAALSDTIHPFVSATYSYEDNLLRLPDGVPGPQGSRSDTMTQLQAGLLFERPIGRQILTGQAKVSRVSFNHYDQFNYSGKDASADWQWFVLRNFSGHVGAAYSQVLTPFTDYHSSERNLRTTRREYADGNWRYHPSWQVHGGVSRTKFDYDLASQRYINRTEDSSDVGIDYLAASGSRFGVLARHIKGTYPNQPVIGGIALDNGYQQDDLKANVYWLINGVTQLQVLAGRSRRDYNFFTRYNSSGANGRVTVFWQPLGKVKFTASTWREYQAIESTLVNSGLVKGVSLAANWAISGKLMADASVRHERRNFNVTTPLALAGEPSDSGNLAQVGLTYTPIRSVQLNVSAFHDTRTGSVYLGTGGYTAKGVSLTATGQF